jgi:quercetin dioxygenase-like cupin family protein
MPDDYAVVDPREVPSTQFDTCETSVRKLTEPLGCEAVRVNRVVVEPGEVTTPHSHDRDGAAQEEVFAALTDGQIAIEGEVHDVPAGGVVRVAPHVVRNLCNRTDEAHVWLAVGAPPVGTVDDFGAYVVADDAE